ncbi:MAG: N-acetylmannosamine-6-phosphate 2-epimerase [Candidatus Obscuribacterales bacterium]|nr:N-acetylmannosamine-6-phosphate 2-epimerase [Candidatus Obscuribacterales bacterium]
MSILEKLKGGLIVSCQASEGEPLDRPEHLWALSHSALNGGACALRLEGAKNIAYMRDQTTVPIIGLSKSTVIQEKDRLSSVYITATYAEAEEIARSGADIIALDATARPRLDGSTLAELIEAIHNKLDKLVWADVSTYEEGLAASELGADVISTTLYGYTQETKMPAESGPDFELLAKLCRNLSKPVVLEGRVWWPADISRAYELGAFSCVVGSAITRPQLITKRFVKAIPTAHKMPES